MEMKKISEIRIHNQNRLTMNAHFLKGTDNIKNSVYKI